MGPSRRAVGREEVTESEDVRNRVSGATICNLTQLHPLPAAGHETLPARHYSDSDSDSDSEYCIGARASPMAPGYNNGNPASVCGSPRAWAWREVVPGEERNGAGQSSEAGD